MKHLLLRAILKFCMNKKFFKVINLLYIILKIILEKQVNIEKLILQG